MKSKGVQLVNAGPEDITKGNGKIILGVIWGMIVRFQLGEISLDGISGKEGLLLWCQRMMAPYDDIKVNNFHRDWANGRAFLCLLEKTYPGCLAEYGGLEKLTVDNQAENLAIAFKVADEQVCKCGFYY